MPHIEFVMEIPTALEEDSYFHVNKRNLIVFDDQTIDASESWFASSKSKHDLYRAESISSAER